MKIPMNKDMEEFKEDIYKGLNMKETALAVLVLFTGVGTFIWAYFFMEISQITSCFLTIMVTFPLGMAAFLKRYGMPIMEYYFRVWDVKRHPLYVYESREEDDWEAACSICMGKSKKKRKRRGKKKERIYFDQVKKRYENVCNGGEQGIDSPHL